MVGRKIFLYALVAMLVATAFAGYVRGIDVDTDTDATTILQIDVFYPNVYNVSFYSWDETADEVTGANLNETQVDVSRVGSANCYAFNASITYEASAGGIDAIDCVYVIAYYDNGLTPANPLDYGNTQVALGGNDNLVLKINLTDIDWTLPVPTATYTIEAGGTSNEHNDTIAAGGTVNCEMTRIDNEWGNISIAFQPMEQVRNALGGGTANAPDDAGTWDFVVIARNVTTDCENDHAADNSYGEFGYFRYVELGVEGGNSQGSGRPNDMIWINQTNHVLYRANVDHAINVSLAGDPTGVNFLGTIPNTNIGFRDWDAGSYDFFLGGPDTVNTYENPMAALDTGTYTNCTTADDYMDVSWQVFIPLGTAEDSYQTAITYGIDVTW